LSIFFSIQCCVSLCWYFIFYRTSIFRCHLISEVFLCDIFTFFGVLFFCCLFKLTQVLLYFDQLKLDEKEINATDFWKRQILIASMHKQPASFGIYVPAKDEAIVEGGNNRRVCNIEIEHVDVKI